MTNVNTGSELTVPLATSAISLLGILRRHSWQVKWTEFQNTCRNLLATEQCVALLVSTSEPKTLVRLEQEDAKELDLEETLRDAIFKAIDTANSSNPDKPYCGDEPFEAIARMIFPTHEAVSWTELRNEFNSVVGVILWDRRRTSDEQDFAKGRELHIIASELLSSIRTEFVLAQLQSRLSLVSCSDDVLREIAHSLKSLVLVDDLDVRIRSAEQPTSFPKEGAYAAIYSKSIQYLGQIECYSSQLERYHDDLQLRLDSCVIVASAAELPFLVKRTCSSKNSIDPDTIAKQMIDEILKLDCAGAVIYRAIPRTKYLAGFCGMDVKGRDFASTPIYYELSERSAATCAFLGVEFQTEHPLTDERVNSIGCEKSGISGHLAAVQLRGEDGTPFGSVVVWWKSQLGSRAAQRFAELKRIVYGLAPLLRSSLYSDSEARRAKFKEQFAKCCQQMTRETDLKENLDAILSGIEACGFKRVRLYEFHYGDTLIGSGSRGMQDATKLFDRNSQDCIQTPVRSNYFTKLVYDCVCNARKKQEQGDQNLLARVYFNGY